MDVATADRLSAEQVFHDRQARERAPDLARRRNGFLFADEEYLHHETWILPAFQQLGTLAGLKVLDFGCGHGMAAVALARKGADVVAFDVSPAYLEEARLRADANGASIELVLANGERLPFADRSFDRIWGNAILHHLDLGAAGNEIARILRPGGIAVFCEPLGENPFLNWARKHLPYPGKQRTRDEQPLRWQQIDVLRKIFPIVELRGYQLLSMARRVWGSHRLIAGLDWCDSVLLNRCPSLQRYCRYLVLTLKR